ncbi:hypothetical protein [Pseudomonas extremaustralis]
MFQIDNSTAVAAIPAPTPAGSAGYFTDGNPATGVSATILPAEFMNMLMMENMNVLSAAGITPAKGQYNQLALAIAKIVQSGAAGPAGEATAGILKLATSPQALAGTDDSTAITPLKLAQKLANFLGQATEAAFGWLKIATQALVNAGADDATAVTPKKLAAAIQNQALTAFTTAGSAGTLTLSPAPGITSYTTPLRYNIKFSQNSTGSDTINVSGAGAKLLKQYDAAGTKVAAVFAIGQFSDVEYDGTDMVLLNQLPVTVASLGVIGGARNLKMFVAAASASATLSADEIIVGVALGGAQFKLASFNKTINLATTGAGGMDTGSAPVSGYVAIYAIYNPTTGVSALLAKNATAGVQTEVYSGANIPAGFIASALLTVVATNGSGQLKACFVRDRKVCIALTLAVSTSIVTSGVATGISTIIPPNAIEVSGELSVASNAASAAGISVAPDSTFIGQQNLTYSVAAGSTLTANFAGVQIVTPQSIYYSTVNGAGSPLFIIYIGSYLI